MFVAGGMIFFSSSGAKTLLQAYIHDSLWQDAQLEFLTWAKKGGRGILTLAPPIFTASLVACAKADFPSASYYYTILFTML